MNLTIKFTLQITATVVLASALAPLALSQQGSAAPRQPSGSGNRSRPSDFRSERAIREVERRDMRAREFNLRMLESELRRRPAERQELHLAYAQIREDYVRLQVVYNGLAQAVSQGGALDPKFVAKSASEIKKCAGRLKYNLALPEPEKDSKRPKSEVGAAAEQLKPSLSALGELIAGFVNNPMFKEVKVVDAQGSAKARRDLEEIIELSGEIKRGSKKLNKGKDED